MKKFLLILFVCSFVDVCWSVQCKDFFQNSSTTTLDVEKQHEELFSEVLAQREPFLEHLFRSGQLQEAAWRARQNKVPELEFKVEAHIKQTLESDKVVDVKPLDVDSKTEVYLVEFSNKLKAIFKPDPKHWKKTPSDNAVLSNKNAEVAAYIYSRLIGTSLVPVTVIREVDGMLGSLQAYIVSGKTMKESNLQGDIRDFVVMRYFDYLIRNADRNSGNVLTYEGRTVAIDHGLSFIPENINTKNIITLDDVKIRRTQSRFFEGLRKANGAKTLKDALREYLDEQQIDALLYRQDQLLKKMSKI